MRLYTRIDFKSEACKSGAGSLPILFVTSSGNPDSADQLLVVEQRKASTNGHQFLDVCELGISDVVVPDMGCCSAGGGGPGLADGDIRREEWRTVRSLERAQVAGGIGDGNCGVKAHVATGLHGRLDQRIGGLTRHRCYRDGL
jgi:hypothetical protein